MQKFSSAPERALLHIFCGQNCGEWRLLYAKPLIAKRIILKHKKCALALSMLFPSVHFFTYSVDKIVSKAMHEG
jgi:hypothetical protein